MTHNGDVVRSPTSEFRSLAKTVTLSARRLAIITILLALLTSCAPSGSAGGFDGIHIIYHPPLLPIEISVAPDGTTEVSADPEIATSIGTFSIEIPLASFHGTLLVIHIPPGLAAQRGQARGAGELLSRNLAGGGEVASGGAGTYYEIEIYRTVNMVFQYTGSAQLTSQGNTVTLNLIHGVTGIRIGEHPGAKSHASRQCL